MKIFKFNISELKDNIRIGTSITLSLLIISSGCKKLITVPAPSTSISQGNVYASDNTAIEVLTDIYGQLSDRSASISDAIGNFYFYPSLSADELRLYDSTQLPTNAFYYNALSSQASYGTNYWTTGYNNIFQINAAIEGLKASNSLTPSVKNQLLGEAEFMRAYFYFYLVNFYGDLPLALGTDPKINQSLSRSPKSTVYDQIISDLVASQELLSKSYLAGNLKTTTSERVRPTYWAATALLARAYLYDNKFDLAQKQASLIIANTGRFQLQTLNGAFLKNTDETIWALQTVSADDNKGYNTGDGTTFILTSAGPNSAGISGVPYQPVYLSDFLLNAFEPGDGRRTNWIGSVTTPSGNKYFYAYKYKAPVTQTTNTEYEIVFRLAEQYLIRAEAEARLGDVVDAVADLNVIRTRARSAATDAVPNPLPNLSASLSKTEIYAAIEKERQVELFTEMSHRWFDMKRTPGFTNPSSTRADEIMPAVCIAKGVTWSPNAKLYPIPLTTINADPNMADAQNPGY